MEPDQLANTIQQHTSQCVKCGLCLPHCPTYTITENECESPRGRIALIEAIAKQQIPLSDKTQLYLDHCLTCRACEAVCPAQVNYGVIIDKGREFIVKQSASAKRLPKLLAFILKHPYAGRILAYLIKGYQRSGLQYLTRKCGLLKVLGLQRAETFLPSTLSTAAWQAYYPARNTKQGQVALFTGCISQLVDRATIKACIFILTQCGYDVYIPPKQRCCGALHQHAGLSTQALNFAEKNITLFEQFAIDKIVTIATACSATLQEYTKELSSGAAREFSNKIIDINQFLLSIAWPTNLVIKPLQKRTAVHIPCSLRNVLKQAHTPSQVLKLIPALEIIALENITSCCGAAGLTMLNHPDMSDTLLDKTLQPLTLLNLDYLITTNIGCALHLQKGLAEKQLKTKVLHPIVLLAEQLIPL